MILDCGCDTLGKKCRLHGPQWDLVKCPDCGYEKAARIFGSKKIVCESCGKGM